MKGWLATGRIYFFGRIVLSPESRQQLTELAYRSIEHGVERSEPLPVDPDEWSKELGEVRSSFVTLQLANELRGCIGSLIARHPLVKDVAEHAYAAAFKDPRFTPLALNELPDLDIHLSVLSSLSPFSFDSEKGLLAMLRPGVDGLVLKSGHNQATFLPEVWDKIRDPVEFVGQLKLKAGLDIDFWSDSLEFERYTTESW